MYVTIFYWCLRRTGRVSEVSERVSGRVIFISFHFHNKSENLYNSSMCVYTVQTVLCCSVSLDLINKIDFLLVIVAGLSMPALFIGSSMRSIKNEPQFEFYAVENSIVCWCCCYLVCGLGCVLCCALPRNFVALWPSTIQFWIAPAPCKQHVYCDSIYKIQPYTDIGWVLK